ncbi:MAG: MBL fold metallo-hydrolase [Armatimonadetes bacterium]|nr:MBL fold metallo-hydrolase [Armatimonadota bacterium]
MAPRLQSVAGLESVFRFEDCCNVYILKDGDRALLIDLGSGAVLDALGALGIHFLDGVYFTHAHRDQCQAANRVAERGVPLRFPQEARAFVAAEERTDLRQVTPLLRAYIGRFNPPRPIPRARFEVTPGARIPWGPFDLETLALPGHLDHQIGYLVDVGGRRLAFCGDVIHSAGKIYEPYHLETDHYTGAGARQAAESLRALRQQRPDALCPSHGPVTDRDVPAALAQTEEALRTLGELKDTICPGRPAAKRLIRPVGDRLIQISAHLWVWNNSYFLVSDTGPVLMVDNAGPLPESFWEQYHACLGERRIEVNLITHIHCDHVEGIEPLRERLRGELEVWAHEAIADAIEMPHRFRRPWLPERGARVDRRLLEAEVFKWREYTFRAFFFPGQTDLHAAYQVMIDGHHALFTGDNFYPPQQWGGTGGLCGLNGGHPLHGWRRSIDLVLQLEPEWLLAAHIQPFLFRPADFHTARHWTEQVAAAMRALAPGGCLERHYNPHVFALEPYVQEVTGRFQVTSRVQNPYGHRVEAMLRLILPEGWRAAPDSAILTIAPDGEGDVEWSIEPTGLGGTHMLTLDLTYGGDYLGEKAECYVRLG